MDETAGIISTDAVEGDVLPAPDLKMIQSRDHPHYGELGWLVPDTVQPHTGQYYFKLSNCQHGVAGCYVLETDLTKQQDKAIEEKPINPMAIDPYKYNEQTEAKLIEAFKMSYNTIEACRHAKINPTTFYDWIKRIPGFEDKMEAAKSIPITMAKKNIVMGLRSGDIQTSRWYAERRDPDFKPKAEIDNNLAIQETRKKIGDFLDDDSPNDGSEQSATSDGAPTGDEVAEATPDIS